MGKSKKLGWHGYVDSHEAIFETIKQLADLKMVPSVAKPTEGSIRYYGY